MKERGEYVYGTDGHEGHWLTGERIVRCHDCKHCRERDLRAYAGEPDQMVCHHFSMNDRCGWLVEPDGFCSWGARKEDK